MKGEVPGEQLLRELVTLNDLEPRRPTAPRWAPTELAAPGGALQASSCPRGPLLIRNLHSSG